jgi:hypothetical protein
VGQDLVCMLSEKFPEKVKITVVVSQRSRVCWRQVYEKGHKRCLLRDISRDLNSAKFCNSQESSKLLYGIGEREKEDWVDSLMTQGVSLSL